MMPKNVPVMRGLSAGHARISRDCARGPGLLWGLCAVVVVSSLVSREANAQDVVEIETEIGMDQLRTEPSANIDMIKPRAAYNAPSSGGAQQNQAARVALDDLSREAIGVETDLGAIVPVSSPRPEKDPAITNPLTDVQVVEISSSLRNLIEDNQRLRGELDTLSEQLRVVRGQQRLEANRIAEIAVERDALRQQNEAILAAGSQLDQQVRDLQAILLAKEEEFNLRLSQMQDELVKQAELAQKQKDDAAAAVQERASVSVDVSFRTPAQDPDELKARSEKVLMALDKVTRETTRLLRDEAKLHYNMGNTYFHQGDYHRAAAEYARAVELTPEDASAHFNLAFVSGEFLNDPGKALEHYKRYLFLNPGAEDAAMVRQKMIDAEISVRADVHFNSAINRQLQQKKNEYHNARQY